MEFYSIHNDDILKSLNQDVFKVSAQFTAMVDIIEARTKEIEHLKSEHYKDDELKRMASELEKAKADLRRGFDISEEEAEAIDQWKIDHTSKYHNSVIGGAYDYIFTPTGIGTVGEIRCTCGQSFIFREL